MGIGMGNIFKTCSSVAAVDAALERPSWNVTCTDAGSKTTAVSTGGTPHQEDSNV
jgi:hypothetical protein